MLRLAPTVRLLQAPLRGWAIPKAHITAKPAKTPTSPKVGPTKAVGSGAQLSIIKQINRQVSHGSAVDYQGDEQAGVARLSWRLPSR